MAALIAGCFATIAPAVNAAPAKDNKNQDFTGTPVDVVVSTDETIFVGDEVTITITVENIADRGLPQLSIWVNGEQVAFWNEVGKGKTAGYEIDVDTSKTGEQSFDIVVWTRLGNKNFQDILYSGTTEITVVAPPETPLVDKLNDAIKNGDFIATGPIVLIVDEVPYTFTSKSGNYNGNGTLFCTVDGVEYKLERNNNGPTRVITN